MSNPDRHALTFLDYSIPAEVDLLFRGEAVVPLEPRPVQVLRYLAAHSGRVVSKQELLDGVWPDVFTTDSVLKRAVSQCRHALGDDANAPAIIETHHGRGYRFIPSVTRVASAVASPATGATRSAPSPDTNDLPIEQSSFVGRDRDLDELERLLRSTRLVTLTGPGGIGKTRLALRLAHRVASSFDGGAKFVGLEALTDPTLVASTVADTVGLRDVSRRDPRAALAESLRDSSVLLVLDNCEHLVEACADLVDGLLRSTDNVRVIATSREALRITGEALWSVSVLCAPDRADATPDRLLEFESVRLFVDRARSAEPAFTLDLANAVAIGSICRRLEGIPLAVELAAARVRSISVDELAARLDDRFRLLTRGERTAPARRQTLRAAIDWSHDLLTEDERRLLRQLAVFVGGFDLDGATAIASDDASGPSVEDVLDRLVDKSLVVARTDGTTSRYRMLDTIRQYSAERLAEAGELDAVMAQHAAWVLDVAETAAAEARRPREREFLARLELEHDNIREALRWWRERAGDPEYGARLAVALRRFWDMHGHWDEGLEWLRDVLSRDADLDPALRADVLFTAGLLGRHQADFETARAQLEECLAIRRAADDTRGVAYALNALGNLLEYTGETGVALKMHEESRSAFQQIGDETGRALSLSALGMCALNRGDYASARNLYEESLRVSRRAGDVASTGIMLHNLGDIAFRVGDAERARELLAESLMVANGIGYRGLALNSLALLGDLAASEDDAPGADALYRQALDAALELGDRVRIAYLLEAFARAAVRQGDPTRALHLAGAAARTRSAIGSSIADDEAAIVEAVLTEARAALGPDAGDAAYEHGESMSLHRAIQCARQGYNASIA